MFLDDINADQSIVPPDTTCTTPAGGGDSLASTRCVWELSPWTGNVGAIEVFRFELFSGGGSAQAPRYVMVFFVVMPRGPNEQRLPRFQPQKLHDDVFQQDLRCSCPSTMDEQLCQC